MARKIRFPLKMKNGAEVRTLDELKENFDLESVLGYFTAGKLTTWLADRYYDDKAESVSALSSDMPDLNAKLCEILEVEYLAENDDTDMELIARRREKLQILSSITDNREILDNVDIVALSQDDLFDILDERPERIYLCGGRFSIPFGAKNIRYIGVNNPLVLLEKGKVVSSYKEAGIFFDNTRFEEGVDITGEDLFIAGKFKEAFPIVEKEANNGNPRSMYLMGLYYSYGYNTVQIDMEQRNNWFRNGYIKNDPLASYWYAKWCVVDGNDQSRIYNDIFNRIVDLANKGDNFALQTLGSMYENGRGVAKDKSAAFRYYMEAAEKNNIFAMNNVGAKYIDGEGVYKDVAEALKWYRRGAEHGFVLAQANLGLIYYKGEDVTQDYSLAFKWYKQAAEQGYALAQDRLGDIYYYGKGVEVNYREAVEWYRKAAEQEYADAQCDLGYMYDFGYGVTKDRNRAIEWYKKAARNGSETAKNNLKNYGIYVY